LRLHLPADMRVCEGRLIRRIIFILLICWMGIQAKESNMITKESVSTFKPTKVDPQAQKGGYGYKPNTNNPPTWLKNASMGGANGKPDWYNNEYQSYMQPTTAGDISNPKVPIAAIMQDASPQAVQNRIKYGTPNLGTSDVKYQSQAQATPIAAAPPPTWLRNIIGSGRAPAYGGQYDPNGQLVEPIVPYDSNPNPDVTQGHLRGSNQPFVIGQDSVYYDPETGIATQGGYRFPLAIPSTPGDIPLDDSSGGRGFRGGSRGYGGYDYGYDSTPSWLNNLMNLYSWQYKN